MNVDIVIKIVKRWMVVLVWGIDDFIEYRLIEGFLVLVLFLFLLL